MTDAALSVAQVAERLGIRTHSVLDLIHSGELRASDVSLKPGGRPRWRILPADLEAFLLRRSHLASPPRRRRRKPAHVRRFF